MLLVQQAKLAQLAGKAEIGPEIKGTWAPYGKSHMVAQTEACRSTNDEQ